MPAMQKHWIAAQAMGREYGFTLQTGHRGHAKLVRPGHRPVTVPSSPRCDDHDMLRLLRQNLRASVRQAAQRG